MIFTLNMSHDEHDEDIFLNSFLISEKKKNKYTLNKNKYTLKRATRLSK